MITKEDLIDLTNRAKRLACAMYDMNESNFHSIIIHDDGKIQALFRGYNFCEWQEELEISLKDVYGDINLFIENFNKIKEENRLKAIADKAKAEKLKQEEADAKELALYNKLTKKFEK